MMRPPAFVTWPSLGNRLRLGVAGLEVSPVCIGMVKEPEVVQAAFEKGINFFLPLG